MQAWAARQSALEEEVIPVPRHKCAGGRQQLRETTLQWGDGKRVLPQEGHLASARSSILSTWYAIMSKSRECLEVDGWIHLYIDICVNTAGIQAVFAMK